MKLVVPVFGFELLMVANPAPAPSWLKVKSALSCALRLKFPVPVRLKVPIVAPPRTSTELVPPTVESGKFATAPIALGTPVPFQPGLVLSLQLPPAPVQFEA